MKQKLKEIWGKADDIILRYPMVLVMAAIAAISAIVAIEMDNEPNQFAVIKMILTGCLGISLMFGVKMLSQRIGKELLLTVIGLLFLFGFYFILPKTVKNFTEMYAFIIIPTFILSHLLVSFVAFFGEKRELNFWQYNKNLFINVFLTAVFTGVLVGGVLLAILAVDKLFDFNFNETLYPKTFSFLAILGSCFIFLLFNDEGLPQLEKDGNYPQILKFFTQFVLIPLLLIYVVILYFYFGKIVINWELPRGWVSYLILAYSVVGILALLLVHPLKEDSTKSWVRIFSKVFYYSLVPLLIMLFIAIFTRILEYGYTEPRYYVLLLAIWLTTVVFYFIFVKKSTIKFVPISLFAFGVFGLVFPYFNAFSVSKRSQKNELEKILTENKLLEKGKINFNKNVTCKTVDEIADKFNFLHQRFQDEYLFSLLTDAQKNKILKFDDNVHFRYIRSTVSGLFTNVEKIKDYNHRIELYTLNKIHNIQGYSYLTKLESLQYNELDINGDKIKAVINPNKTAQLKLVLNGKETLDFAPFIEKTLENYNPQPQRILVDDISSVGKLGKYEVKIIFENLSREKVENKLYYSNNAYILIK